MKALWGFVSGHALAFAALTLLTVAGCGGGSSPGGSNAGSGGSGEDAGSAGKAQGGSPAGGSSAGGEAGESEGGAAGEAPLPPAQNHSSVAFVSAGNVSTSKHFRLISSLGESLGGTKASKRAKSQKYTFIPGVAAATSP